MIKMNIKPENAVERLIVEQDEWQRGVRWGKRRPGHPEGQVLHHIVEVLANVERYFGDTPLRERLRLIALVHDTFKFRRDEPGIKRQPHGVYAREFARQFISEEGLLNVIEWHDEAYKIYRRGVHSADWHTATVRACELIDRLGSYIDLYLSFFLCDNRTGDKTPDSYDWFHSLVHATDRVFPETGGPHHDESK